MGKVRFIEDTHSYIGEDGERWTSVTSFLHKFEPKKDWEEIARKYGKKHGLSTIEVQSMWKAENKKAIDRGTLFHKIREEELLGCETINNLLINKPIIEGDIKISPPQKLLTGIYPELLVTLESANLCGQADYVEVTEDNILIIKDFKTNKEIKQKAFTSWDGVEDKLTGPLSNIPNCNYWLYALQLNTYAYIIKRNNPKLKIGKLELLHIIFDESNEVKQIVPYELPNLQTDIKRAIEYFKIQKK